MIRSATARTLAAMLVAAAFTSSLSAQASRRDGFWFSGGLGGGSLGCKDCGDRVNGGIGDVALGGTINKHVLLGVGTAGWSREENGVRLTAATLDARVRVYPSVTNGFFFTAGLGLGSLKGEFGLFGSETQTGTSALLGLGYDIAVGKKVSLTPFVSGVGVKTKDTDTNFGQLGLAIVFH
jgi:hypothetical protein